MKSHEKRQLTFSRRLLGAAVVGVGLGVGACAPGTAHSPTRAPSPSPPPPAPADTGPASSPPSAQPVDSPTPTRTGPDPEAVARRYAGVQPQDWGMHLPGIVSELERPFSADGRPCIALTLDACGGRSGAGYDERLVSGLVAFQVPTTLFVNLRWLEANPDIAAELAADPLFELGNHGTRHVPLSVTGREAYGIAGSASAREAVDEVWGCHEHLTALTGTPPRLFRSGTAHYDDVGVAIALALGETPIGFSTNGDGGATFPAPTVRSEVAATDAGGIVIAHFNRPDSGTAEGMLAAVEDLLAKGAEFVHL